ncbi:MAG: hypothetical protein WCP11_02180 [Candidatus Saccharibacteria bacterium]
MRVIKYTLGLILCLLFFSSSVSAEITVIDPPEPIVYPSVFVTGFQMTDKLDVVELYNESSTPVDMSKWSLQYDSLEPGKSCNITFQDWILPEGYVVAARIGMVLSNDGNVLRYTDCARHLISGFNLTLNKLDDNDQLIKQETIKSTASASMRRGLTKTYRSGDFGKDFTTLSRSLYAGEWYSPPQSLLLEISEILPNPRSCSPIETSLDCKEYVKLYNPIDQAIDLSQFRIRNGYAGQSSTSSNTKTLDGWLQPGHFVAVPMGVTNSESYLWLEDFYGAKTYANTVLQYPDASSDTKKSQAWAYDVSDGIWKWTPTPNPTDTPSIFPAPPPPAPVVVISSTPVTVVSTSSTFVPCKEGQYRNEETNRCRNIEVAVATLEPCGVGQERNPATNRCRSITAVLGDSDLRPCDPGQERNPETNRCRNIVSSDIPKADYAPEQTGASQTDYTSWFILGGIGLVAVGYGVWEWRSELVKLFKNVLAFLRRRK